MTTHACNRITRLGRFAFFAAGMIAAASAFAADAIVLKYANFPPAPTFPCVQMERWKTEIEKRTGDKVKVQTYPGGTLLGAKNMVDGVEAGTADIGCFAMSYQPGRFPVSEAVDLPLGFATGKGASQALFDLITERKPAEFGKVKLITLFTCPPANLMTSKPVKGLEDLKGMELRVSGTGVDVLKAMGGVPIAMPQSETPDAIQKGVVKGIVSSLEILKDFNFAAYCPFVTRENLNCISFAVVMNKSKWDALPDDVKKAIDDLSRDQCVWTGEYVDKHGEDAVEWAKKEKGLQVFEFPAADKAKLPGLFQPIVDSYIERAKKAGVPGDEIVKQVTALKAKYEPAGK